MQRTETFYSLDTFYGEDDACHADLLFAGAMAVVMVRFADFTAFCRFVYRPI